MGVWYEHIGHFITKDNFMWIIPLQSMTFEDKLNAILRFFLYLGVVLALIRADSRYLFFPVLAGLATILVNESHKNVKQKQEAFLEREGHAVVDNQLCVRSTVENPFMNVMFGDGKTLEDRAAACNVLDKRVQRSMNDNFNAKLFRDVSDIYGNMSSQREFYTVPNTSVPNNAVGFAEFCYGTGKTCKEGNGKRCWAGGP